MEINQQIFKAPLLPKRKKISKKKISKTTISSSVFTGALQSEIFKLNKSIFSFIKPVPSIVDPTKLAPVPQEVQPFQSPEEGRNLLDQQKEIASDFENRVAEEKKKIFALFQNLQQQGKLKKTPFSFVRSDVKNVDPTKLAAAPQDIQSLQSSEKDSDESEDILEKQKEIASDFADKVEKEKKNIFDLVQNLKEQITLKKTPFKFLRSFRKFGDSEKLSAPKIGQNNFEGGGISETNNILLEIKKQLELDYQARIDEEKAALTLEKKKIAAERVAGKEAKIETGSTSIIGKTFEKVTAPFKSIFQKLIDFFSIIFTGILLNNAFRWLSKKENQEKLTQFFNFLKEYWQELLIIFAAYKLAKLVGAVYKVSKLLRKLINWFRKKPPTPPKPPSGAPAGPKILPSKPLSRMNESYARFISGKSNLGDRLRLLRRGQIGVRQLFTRGGVEALRGTVKTPTPTPTVKPKTSIFRNLGKVRSIGRGGAVSILTTLAEIFKPQLQEMVGSLYGQMGIGIENLSNEELLKQYKESKRGFDKVTEEQKKIPGAMQFSIEDYDFGRLKILQDEVKRRGLKFSKGGTIPKFSLGGTVGKGDKPGVDTTPAQTRGGGKVLLNEGEEVVKTSSSMLFRPLIKDINDNAGRMWQAFESGIKRQDANNSMQLELTTRLGEVIQNFKDYVESEIKKRKDTNISPSPSPSPTPPAPTSGETSAPSAPSLPATPSASASAPAPAAPSQMSPAGQTDSAQAITPSSPASATPPSSQTAPTESKTSDAASTVKLSSVPPKELPPEPTSTPTTPPPAAVSTGIPEIKPVDDKSKNMMDWAKKYTDLASIAAERERTRGTSETKNPLMERVFGKEYVGKLEGPTSSFKESFSKLTKVPENLIKETKGGKVEIINLPPNIIKTPPKQQKSGKTSNSSTTPVPSISPVDMTNSYNSIAVKIYGMVGLENLYASVDSTELSF